MPSENSFMDRIGRFTLLKDACGEMTPGFTPADGDITLSAQSALLDTLNLCCENVSTALNDLKDVTDPRVTLLKTIKERATRAVNRVASNRAWAAKLPAVKAAGDKLRGFKVPKSKVPPPPADPDAPAPKKRDSGGRSFKDAEGYLFKFMGALSKCSGYDTGAPLDIAIGSSSGFTFLHNSLKTANESVPGLETALHDVQIERLRVFQSKVPLPDGSHSLRDRWARIKKAVISQYGRTSAQYEMVRGIKY